MQVHPVLSKYWQRIQNPPQHRLTDSLFLRLLGLVYLSAFASFLTQILGLLGSHGIAPLGESLDAIHNAFGIRSYYYVPSLFWLDKSDSALQAVCILGCLASLLMIGGLFSRPAAASCFVLYLSVVSAGRPFTGFQWDALLLECGFLALFTGAPMLFWAYRFLLFRLLFESGVVKLINDTNWRNLHALRFHFMTQPLPTPLAYYFYRAPAWLLDSLTAATLAIELIAPFLLFCSRRLRYFGGTLLIVLQLIILLTGNYAFFNLLALSLCMWAFDDATYLPIKRMLERVYPRRTKNGGPLTTRLISIAIAILMVVGATQVLSLLWRPLVMPLRSLTSFLEPFELVNSYGLFAVMTTSRPEIVLEGSDDQTSWLEYSFRFKPGNVHRGLPLVAPYQPRLDWQMWFAALGSYRENPWVSGLIYRLLLNDPATTALLDPGPFVKPPHYIRAMLYEYSFSLPGERAQTGAVWRRRQLGIWLNPVSLPETKKIESTDKSRN